MGFTSMLKKRFGDQSERAVRPLWQRLEKEINPISEQLLSEAPDQLRHRIDLIRDDLRGEAKTYKDRMDEIRAEIEPLDSDKREPLWKQIDDRRED